MPELIHWDWMKIIALYKRDGKDTIINQGLFYMDWLVRHQKDFEWIVLEKLGKDVVDKIDWDQPRLICIAQDFNRYDEFAIKQMQKNIDLIRYRLYENNHLLLELVNTSNADTPRNNTQKSGQPINKNVKTVLEKLEDASGDIQNLYKELDDYLLSLGDEVQKKVLMHYIAYRRLKNFASVEIHKNEILIFVKVDADTITPEKGFTRDVRNIGHFGTGQLEITIKNFSDLEKAKPLIEKSLANS